MEGSLQSSVSAFLEVLGLTEEPMGMCYTDEQPAVGTSPKPAHLPSVEEEAQGQVDFSALWANFSCVIGQLWIARHRKTAAYFDRERFGCIGGAFYLGFLKPQLDFIAHYVSTGIPNALEGERYFESPEKARKFFDEIDPIPAPKRFCVFKPVTQFVEPEKPELVVFFARPEVISGLHQFCRFFSDDWDTVSSPFGAGCANIVTWPLKYMAQGRPRPVLGGWDPSERRYLGMDELTFTIPYEMFLGMLEKWPHSFLTASAWQAVKKRIAKASAHSL